MTCLLLGRATMPGTAVCTVNIGALVLIKIPVRNPVYVIIVM